MRWVLALALLIPLLVLVFYLPYPVVGDDYTEVDNVDIEELDLETSMLVLSSGDETLEMYISIGQGFSIEQGLFNTRGDRPNTHDLQASILTESGVSVLAVTVDTLTNSYYTATLHLKNGIITREVDCRPSDCIALALRVDAPIYVKRDLFSQETVETPRDVIPA
jgi:bifunctional DNase/RNase